MATAFKDFLTISRAEIQLTSLPTAALGVTLGSTGFHDLLSPAVLLYVVLFFTLLTFSCNLNCACDLDVDDKYKTRLSAAVRALGIARLRFVLRVELIISLALIIWLAVLKHNLTFLLAATGLFLGFAYSAPPLRIKKRGAASFLPVMGGLYFMPIIGGWFLVTERVNWFILFFGLGYALLMQGITFINTCEDFREDEASGIATMAHVLGVRRTLFLGAGLVLTGGILDVCLVLGRVADLPNESKLRAPWIYVLIMVFLAAVVEISRRLSVIGRSTDPLMLSKRGAAAMPLWFFLTRYSLWAAALLSMGSQAR